MTEYLGLVIWLALLTSVCAGLCVHEFLQSMNTSKYLVHLHRELEELRRIVSARNEEPCRRPVRTMHD